VLDSLRVYFIQPACFEYMLTSVMDKAEGRKMLSFNHINGRTVFAGVGEAMGEYTVKSFEPSVERTFNKSINSYIEKKGGVAKLQSSDGKRVSLEMGKMLPLPGWIACLIWIDNGSWMYVSKDEVIPAGGKEVMVASISTDTVSVVSGNLSNNVPFISDGEKNQLVAMWEERKKAAEEARLAAQKQPEEPEKQVVTQVIRYVPQAEPDPSSPLYSRMVDIRMPPQFFYGTEYRYPVSFETIPVLQRTAAGVMVRNGIVVPKRFETGFWGNAVMPGSSGSKVDSHGDHGGHGTRGISIDHH